MGRDRVDVGGADLGRFQISENQQGGVDSANDQLKNAQNGEPAEVVQEQGAAEQNERARPANRREITTHYTKDVSLQDFEALLPAQLAKGDKVSFDSSGDAAVTSAIDMKNKLIEKKGYVRFQHVKGDATGKLKLDRVKHWLWLPFVGISFRTNLGDSAHNKALRNTFYEAVKSKFEGVSVPLEIMDFITGHVREVSPEHRSTGVGVYQLSRNNDTGALESNEVTQTLYRYNTVLNTEEARKRIFEETLLSAVKKLPKFANAGIENLPANLTALGFDLPSDGDWVKTLAGEYNVSFTVTPQGDDLKVDGETKKVTGTMAALRDSADAFITSVKKFQEAITKKLQEQKVEHGVKDTVDFCLNFNENIETVSTIFQESLITDIHQDLTNQLLNLDPAGKKELGIDTMREQDLADLVAYFCAGSRSDSTAVSPLTAVLDSLCKKLKVKGESEKDATAALRELPCRQYLSVHLQSFIKSYLSITKEVEGVTGKAEDGQDGQAASRLTPLSQRLESTQKDGLMQRNKQLADAFGKETSAQLEHGKIMKAVLMDAFCDYYRSKFSGGENEGLSQEEQALFMPLNSPDDAVLRANMTLKEAVNRIKGELSGLEAKDYSEDFFKDTVDGADASDDKARPFVDKYDFHIVDQLASVVVDQQLERDIKDSNEAITRVAKAGMAEDKDVNKIRDNGRKEETKDTGGIIAQALRAWHKISFGKNTYNLVKNIADFKVGGLFTVANSVKNVGMAGWTLKTDIVNLFTDRANRVKSLASLKKLVDTRRQAVFNSAFNLDDQDSVVSTLASALKDENTKRMCDAIIDKVKSVNEKEDSNTNQEESSIDFAHPLRPVDGSDKVEYLGSEDSNLDTADTLVQLGKDFAKEIKAIQEKPFELFGFSFSFLDKTNSGAGYENQLRTVLKSVDAKTMAASLGIAYSAEQMERADVSNQRALLIDLCIARFTEAMNAAMTATVKQFAADVAESYGNVHSAVLNEKTVDPNEYVCRMKNRSYTLSDAGKRRLQRVAMEQFALAYHAQLDSLANVITGKISLVQDPNSNEKITSPADHLSRDVADLDFQTLADRAMKTFLTEQNGNSDAAIAVLRKTYPNTFRFYQTWESAKLYMENGFVRRLYDEAILENLKPGDISDIAVKKTSGDQSADTYSAKVQKSFSEKFAKTVGSYLKNTEAALTTTIESAEKGFFDNSAAEELDDSQKALLKELEEQVGKDPKSGYLRHLIGSALATRKKTDNEVMAQNNAYDGSRNTQISEYFERICRSKDFMCAALGMYAAEKNAWEQTIKGLNAELALRTSKGIEIVGSIFDFVETQSDQAEAQKGMFTQLFDRIKASFTGASQATEWAKYLEKFGISENDDWSKKGDGLKRMIGTNRPFLALIRKLVEKEINDTIAPNMQTYAGSADSVFQSALKNVAQKVYAFMPQFLSNWSQLSTYDKYLDAAMNPNGAGVRAVEQAVEAVSLKMFEDHQARLATVAQEDPAKKDEAYLIDDRQLEDYYKTFVDVRDTFLRSKPDSVSQLDMQREALKSNETVANALNTAVGTAVTSLMTTVKDQLGVTEAVAGLDKTLTEHAVWVLETKIAARCTSPEEVVNLLNEKTEDGKEPNWLRKLVNDVVATIADSAKALSVETFLADRNIDANTLKLRNLSLAAFREKYPNAPVFTSGISGCQMSQQAQTWLQDELGKDQPISVAVRKIIRPEKVVDESKFEAIYERVRREKSPSLDDVFAEFATGEAPNGFWTGKDNANAQGLQAAVVQRCIADLDALLAEGIEITGKDAIPDADKDKSLATAATAYRAALLKRVADILKKDENDFSAGMINRLKEEGKAQIREAFLAEIERESRLGESARLFTSFVDTLRQNYAKEAGNKLSGAEKDAAIKQAAAGLTNKDVLDRFLDGELVRPHALSPLADFEKSVKARLTEEAVFDQILFDYTKNVFALTYANVVGGYNVATAALNAQASDQLYYPDLIKEVGAQQNSNYTSTDFARSYRAYYPDSDIKSFMVNLSKEITEAVLATGYEKDFFKYRRTSETLKAAREGLKKTITGLVEKYEKGYPSVIQQRDALLTGFNGIQNDFYKNERIQNLIEMDAREMVLNVWLQKMDIAGDPELLQLYDGLHSVIQTEKFPKEFPEVKTKDSQFANLFTAVSKARDDFFAKVKEEPEKAKQYMEDRAIITNLDFDIIDLERRAGKSTKAMKALEAKKADRNAKKKAFENKYKTWSINIFDTGLINLDNAITAALNDFNAYVKKCREEKKFTQADLIWVLGYIGAVADKTKAVDSKQVTVDACKERVKKSFGKTLLQFVKSAHNPEEFFANKEWSENGRVFGFLPIKTQIATTSADSIFAAAKEFVAANPELAKKQIKDKREGAISLPEFLSYFSEKDKNNDLNTYISSLLTDGFHDLMEEVEKEQVAQ